MFLPPAAAGAAAINKQVRDETVGKASNQGTGNGGIPSAAVYATEWTVNLFCLPTCTSEPTYGALLGRLLPN